MMRRLLSRLARSDDEVTVKVENGVDNGLSYEIELDGYCLRPRGSGVVCVIFH